MKKHFSFFLALLLIGSLFSCARSVTDDSGMAQAVETDENGRYFFTAKVLSCTESSLLVESTSSSGGIREGDQVSVSRQGLTDEVKKGYSILIFFDGLVMETYPLQISGVYEIRSLTKE